MRGRGGRTGRRRLATAARRSVARTPGSAVPGRASGVEPAGAGSPARTARVRHGDHLARGAAERISGTVPAGRRDEPLSLRLGGGRRRAMPLPGRRGRALPRTRVRPAARSHRPACRSAAAAAGAAAPRCPRGRIERGRAGAGGSRACDRACTRRRGQCAARPRRDAHCLSPRSARPGVAGTGDRQVAVVRAVHAAGASGRAHDRRPGRRADHRYGAPHRGAGLPENGPRDFLTRLPWRRGWACARGGAHAREIRSWAGRNRSSPCRARAALPRAPGGARQRSCTASPCGGCRCAAPTRRPAGCLRPW